MMAPSDENANWWSARYPGLRQKWEESRRAKDEWEHSRVVLTEAADTGQLSRLSVCLADVAAARSKWQTSENAFLSALARMEDEARDLELAHSPIARINLDDSLFSASAGECPTQAAATAGVEAIATKSPSVDYEITNRDFDDCLDSNGLGSPRNEAEKMGHLWSDLCEKLPAVADTVRELAASGNQLAVTMSSPKEVQRTLLNLEENMASHAKDQSDARRDLAEMESFGALGVAKTKCPAGEESKDQKPASKSNPRLEDNRFQNMAAKSLMTDLTNNPSDGPLIPKKKFRQLKLKQAFVRKNFQKYPISKCRWVQSIQQFVYQPPKYGKEFDHQQDSICCHHCYLTPYSLFIGKKDKFVQSLAGDYEDPQFAVQNAGTIAHNLLHKYFGKNYMKRMKLTPIEEFRKRVPACIRVGLDDTLLKVQGKAEELGGRGVKVDWTSIV